MDLQAGAVVLPHEQEVLVVCESQERGLFGQTKQTYSFSLPPHASVDVVKEVLADKLSVAPSCVHLQTLVREGHEYETVTRGTVADLQDASNPLASTVTLVYTTETHYGCFYICCAALCAACCAAGYAVGKENQKEKQRRRPPPQQHHDSHPYGSQNANCAQYPQAAPAGQYYQNTNGQPPQGYAYGSPVAYTPQPQQNAYQAAPPNANGAPPPQYYAQTNNPAPAPL